MALNYGVRQGNLIVCVFRKLQSTFLYNFVIYISTIKIEYFSPHRKAWILWHIEKELELEYNIFFFKFWYRILCHFYLFLWFFSTRFGMNTYLSDTLKVRTWYYTCSMMDQIWCQSYKNSGNAWLDSETHSFTSFCLFFAIGRILNWVELCFSHFIIQFLKKMVDFLFLFLVFVNLFFCTFWDAFP